MTMTIIDTVYAVVADLSIDGDLDCHAYYIAEEAYLSRAQTGAALRRLVATGRIIRRERSDGPRWSVAH